MKEKNPTQNATNTFHNLYHEYWDLITKFWAGSSKWNTPFSCLYLVFADRVIKSFHVTEEFIL